MNEKGIKQEYLDDYKWLWRFGITKSCIEKRIKEEKTKHTVPDIENVDRIFGCAYKAYDDLKRTLHGVGAWNEESKKDYRTQRSFSIVTEISKLFDKVIEWKIKNKPYTEVQEVFQEEFNKWHKDACAIIRDESNAFTAYTGNGDGQVKLDNAFAMNGKKKLIKDGLAQKWLNMTLKNMMALGLSDELSAISHCLHVPIDSKIIIKASEKPLELKKPNTTSWSSMEYKDYSIYQENLRRAICEYYLSEFRCPLEWEFSVWGI